MIRTLRALLLAAFLVGSGVASAQDPVTERPGVTQPLAAPKQIDAPKQIETPRQVVTPRQDSTPRQARNDIQTLVLLEGREEWGNTGALSFHVYPGGKVVMIDATRKPVTGTGKADGNRVTFVFGNCVYEGIDVNGVFSGRARFTSGPEAGQSWGFRVAARHPLLGRTFAGQETLSGYGDVSFRFLEGGAVEMRDRDGVTRGAYVQNGARVTMTFGNASYTGDIRGDAIVGSARNMEDNWTFQISASR